VLFVPTSIAGAHPGLPSLFYFTPRLYGTPQITSSSSSSSIAYNVVHLEPPDRSSWISFASFQ
jgi:hypothetical protein